MITFSITVVSMHEMSKVPTWVLILRSVKWTVRILREATLSLVNSEPASGTELIPIKLCVLQEEEEESNLIILKRQAQLVFAWRRCSLAPLEGKSPPRTTSLRRDERAEIWTFQEGTPIHCLHTTFCSKVGFFAHCLESEQWLHHFESQR